MTSSDGASMTIQWAFWFGFALGACVGALAVLFVWLTYLFNSIQRHLENMIRILRNY
jgi:H+/Cl- antiporter ClcA